MNVPIKQENEKEKPSSDVKKIILYGAGCVGKTFSLATILQDRPDLRLVCLMTERNAMSGLEAGLEHYKIQPKENQIIYSFPEEGKAAFVDLQRAFEKHTKQSKKDALKGNSDSTEGKENYQFITKVIQKLVSFSGECLVSGQTITIGNVGKLTSNDVLIIDGLSPIVSELWNSIVGDKIVTSQTDYLPVQRALYAIFTNLQKLACHVILLAHEKEELEEKDLGNGKTITSLKEIRVNTNVGNANYQLLMGTMTDVIYCYKFGTLFKWSGNKPKVFTAARHIPNKDNIESSFAVHKVFSRG